MFTIIVAVGNNGEIGKNNSLLWNLPDDLKFFKKITMNSKIVMGRKTFESLPGRLKNRLYYIITSNTEFSVSYATMINNLDDFIDENKDTEEEIFIIGGGSIYKYFLPYVKRMYITEVDKCYLDADCYFPNYDKSKWKRKLLYSNFQNGINFNNILLEKI